MNQKIKKIALNWRVILLVFFLVLAIFAIHPDTNADGVAIRTILKNSSASLAGIEKPKATTPPMSREVILSVDNIPIHDEKEYYDVINKLTPDRTVSIVTNRGAYTLKTQPELEIIELNETEVIQVNESVNGTTFTVNKTVPKVKTTVLGTKDIGLRVYDAPTTNIRKGLDLQGGTRVLLQPVEIISQDDMEFLLQNMGQRLDVYGLSDVVVKEAGDLSGNQFIVVEVAGVNEEEVRDLLSKQGKFEAKIGNETVFIGGQDIPYVCRTADCSGIDPQFGCQQTEGGFICRFRFAISLTPEAAERQAQISGDLDIISVDDTGQPLSKDQQYLSEKLSLYLDDQLVDELNIGSDLKGRAVTDIQISGSGVGITQQEAMLNSLEDMKTLQTVLKTGTLPVKLNIVKTDNVSPVLGEEFASNALLIGLLAMLAVTVFITIRYRNLKVSVPILITMLSEIVLLLGLASLIGWNIDLAAIAGIIIAVGTGVDHQIVITDEIKKKEEEYTTNWRQKIKRAFFIIMAAYLTTMVAMIPLIFAGAGLLRGFAITTMMGVTFGVIVTRPAYASIVEILLKD